MLWLIYVWNVSRYDVSWLIVFTWLRSSELLLCYDWFMFETTHICESYEVMTFARNSVYESRVSHIRVIRVVWYVLWFMIGKVEFHVMTQYESGPGGTKRWWVTRVRVEWRSRYKYRAEWLDRRPRSAPPIFLPLRSTTPLRTVHDPVPPSLSHLA